MAEAYPSDNDLLNVQSDAETGVEYIPTGTAPYYLHFRKLLHRLLLATRRANDLRVYDEGGLDIGVKAGKFWLGTELVSYAGSTGNTLADNQASIYVYLTGAGVLVLNEYTGFPSMAVAPHVRLAVVTTCGGDITSITDCRSGNNISVPYGAGGIRRNIEAHASDDTLAACESGSVHTNGGATGTVVLSLPASAPQGTIFTFAVQAACELRIEPGDAAIRDDSGQTAGRYKSADAVGACLTLIADANGRIVAFLPLPHMASSKSFRKPGSCPTKWSRTQTAPKGRNSLARGAAGTVEYRQVLRHEGGLGILYILGRHHICVVSFIFAYLRDSE